MSVNVSDCQWCRSEMTGLRPIIKVFGQWVILKLYNWTRIWFPFDTFWFIILLAWLNFWIDIIWKWFSLANFIKIIPLFYFGGVKGFLLKSFLGQNLPWPFSTWNLSPSNSYANLPRENTFSAIPWISCSVLLFHITYSFRHYLWIFNILVYGRIYIQNYPRPSKIFQSTAWWWVSLEIFLDRFGFHITTSASLPG